MQRIYAFVLIWLFLAALAAAVWALTYFAEHAPTWVQLSTLSAIAAMAFWWLAGHITQKHN